MQSTMKKKILTVVMAATLVFCTGVAAQAVTVDATVTADNHYALYVGDASSVSTYIGRNEMGFWGSTGGYNFSAAESFSFGANWGEYLYLAGWGDNSAYQGLIGQFVVSGGPTILTKTTGWEKFLTYEDLGDGSPEPTVAGISAYVAGATWAPVTDSIAHGGGPWGNIAGISPSADWIWGTALGSSYGVGEYQIFRTQLPAATPIPEPATMILLGSGLIGLAGYGRKKFFKK